METISWSLTWLSLLQPGSFSLSHHRNGSETLCCCIIDVTKMQVFSSGLLGSLGPTGPADWRHFGRRTALSPKLAPAGTQSFNNLIRGLWHGQNESLKPSACTCSQGSSRGCDALCWQALRQSSSSTQSSLPSKSHHFQSPVSDMPVFVFPMSFRRGGKKIKKERRDVHVLALQYCRCKPSSKIREGLWFCHGRIITGFSSLN